MSGLPRIVVAGDIAVDWFQFSMPGLIPAARKERCPQNWQLHSGTRMVARPGGALQLARLVRLATGECVATHEMGPLEAIPPEEVIHSIAILRQYPASRSPKDAQKLLYRVERCCGYSGPLNEWPHHIPLANDHAGAELLVLDDSANGFRDRPDSWPAALADENARPTIVFKMARPLAQGPLWDAVRRRHADRLVVVLNADDLRAEGVRISRRLSWERAAKEFVWQLVSNPHLTALANCKSLVVRFAVDAAIHYSRRDGQVCSTLHYDPELAEDGFLDELPGTMFGHTGAFVGALAAHVLRNGIEAAGDGIPSALHAVRRLCRLGFGKDADHLDYPGAELFAPATSDDAFLASIQIPNPSAPEPADPHFWSILKDHSRARLEDIAYDVVVQGSTASLQGVPLGRFRGLRTVDRTEIESYRALENLMREYLQTPNPKRPLCIAVYGPPGSGKSFGVAQVADSVSPGQIKTLEFNVAQFVSTADLVSAFHRVRDEVLGGKVPLVFLDEFDCQFDGRLGWLRYFLAPMQDGKFKDGETLHPIGKAILVFAGGTSNTYEEFSREPVADETSTDVGQFREAKGPDFVSRLRGFVNVLGPNAVDENDGFYMLRRATLLRSLLERKAPQLIESTGRVRIDPGVLRAMIKVPRYKHGVRSMEAILDMSTLAGRSSFEQASLPAATQLKLHVDPEMFSRLVVRDVLFGGARELIGMAIHELYREHQNGKRPPDDPAMSEWEALPEDLRNSNLQQADHILIKLRTINCGFSPTTHAKPPLLEFTPEELDLLAQMEHDRYVAERRLAGWTEGPRSIERHMNPTLVPWSDLPAEEKVKDVDAVRGIPELMARAHFEIYRFR